MAATAITNAVISKFNELTPTFPVAVALSATDGALITSNAPDEKMLVIVQNSDTTNAETVTIKAGTGYAGASDLEVSVAASTTKMCVLESARFKDSDGKIKISGSTGIKISCVVLP